MANIVLIGFMGTGKTSAGKMAAARLGMKFVDTDREVEEVTGMAIKDIFARYGEKRFRSEEAAAVNRVADRDNQVISTGGGVVLNPANISSLSRKGVIIALEASPEVILHRVSRKNTRPLLQQGNPMETIKKLLGERKQLYKQAPHHIDTTELTLNQVVDKIIEIYQQEVKKHGKING